MTEWQITGCVDYRILAVKGFKKEGRGWRDKPKGTYGNTHTSADFFLRHKGYSILNTIIEATARKIECSASEILTSNPNHRAKSSATSKANYTVQKER